MSVLLNKHNLAVSDFAATEESRYSMRAILVTERETVATDGHRLVRVSTPKPESNSAQFPLVPGFRNGAMWKNFLLSIDGVKQVIKALPNGKVSKSLPILAHACVGHFQTDPDCEPSPNIAVTDLDNAQVFTPRPVTGQFPAWEKVIPTKPPVFEIYVNASYLADLARSATKFTDDSDLHVIRLSFTGTDQAIRMDARNRDSEQSWTAMLMPIRGSKESVLGVGSLPDVPQPEVPDPFADVEATTE